MILVSHMIVKQGQASWKSNIPGGGSHANELRTNVVGLRGPLFLGETTTHFQRKNVGEEMIEMIVGALSLACEGAGKNVVAVGNGRGSDVVKRVGFFSGRDA